MPMKPAPVGAGAGAGAGAGISPMDVLSGGGGWQSALVSAGVSAIGSYFQTQAMIKGQERGWEHEIRLEQMRIEAEKELERMRNTIDPAIYAMLKKEIMKPLGPHGGGTGKPPTGTYRKMLEPKTATPMPGGGSPGEFDKYLMGG
jgi:hypothetical protein